MPEKLKDLQDIVPVKESEQKEAGLRDYISCLKFARDNYAKPKEKKLLETMIKRIEKTLLK